MAEQREAARLLQAIKQGSREDFDQFYEQYIGFVFRIAISILKNKQEAEDVCHDIFIEVFQKPDHYDPEKGSVHAWLAVKTKSRCLDYIRKKKPVLKERLDDLLTSETELVESTEFNVLAKIEQETVKQALKSLPVEQCNVLYGAYFEGRTQREMAQEMNRPLGTIKSIIRYGLKNLRKEKTLLHWAEPNEGGKKNGW